jgi:hypothetical protein
MGSMATADSSEIDGNGMTGEFTKGKEEDDDDNKDDPVVVVEVLMVGLPLLGLGVVVGAENDLRLGDDEVDFFSSSDKERESMEPLLARANKEKCKSP